MNIQQQSIGSQRIGRRANVAIRNAAIRLTARGATLAWVSLWCIALAGCGRHTRDVPTSDARASDKSDRPVMDAEGETQTSGAAQEASGPICVALTTPPWPVRRDSVGMFATRMTVQQLRRACPVAYDTVMWNDEGVSYSAVALPMPGLLIVAVQTWTSNTLDEGDARAPSPLDEHRPANLFYITGPAGQLPGGVRLTASWRELTRAYGSATMETEVSMSEVQFARLPGIFVTLDWSYPVEGRDVVLDSASAVPERTRIERVVVARTAETL